MAGSFMKAYEGNRDEAHTLALEGSPIAALVQALAGQADGWEGTAAELLVEINAKVGDAPTRRREWPKTPRGLTGELKRIAPNLRATVRIVLIVRDGPY